MSVSEQLAESRVLVVGAGALGCVAAAQLVGSGVGLLGVVDPAAVERSDLPGQSLLSTPDLGRGKAERAAARLGTLNPDAQIDSYPALLDRQNVLAVIVGHGLVVDCSDDGDTHRLLNEACLELGVPLVASGLAGNAGWLVTVHPGSSACYVCALPVIESRSKARNEEAAPLAGVVGSLQAVEALRLLTESGEPLLDRVLWLDCGGRKLDQLDAPRRASCEACAHVTDTLEPVA